MLAGIHLRTFAVESCCGVNCETKVGCGSASIGRDFLGAAMRERHVSAMRASCESVRFEHFTVQYSVQDEYRKGKSKKRKRKGKKKERKIALERVTIAICRQRITVGQTFGYDREVGWKQGREQRRRGGNKQEARSTYSNFLAFCGCRCMRPLS